MHFCAIMASCLALKVLYVMLTISLHIRKPSPCEMTVRELKMTDRNSDKQLFVLTTDTSVLFTEPRAVTVTCLISHDTYFCDICSAAGIFL